MEELETLRNKLAEIPNQAGKPETVSIIPEALPEEESSKFSNLGPAIEDKSIIPEPLGDHDKLAEPILVRKKTLKEIFATTSSCGNQEEKPDSPEQNVPSKSLSYNAEPSNACLDNTDQTDTAAGLGDRVPSRAEISQLLRLNLSKLNKGRRERSAVRESGDRDAADAGVLPVGGALRLPKIASGTPGTLACPEDLDGSNPYGLVDNQTLGATINNASSRRSSRDPGCSSSRRSSRDYGRYQKKLRIKPGQTESSGGSKDLHLKQNKTGLLKKANYGNHRGSLQLPSASACWESQSGISGIQRSHTLQDENSTQLPNSVRYTAPDGFCLVDNIDNSSLEMSRTAAITQNVPEHSSQVLETNSVNCEANLLKNFDTFDKGAERVDQIDSCREMKKMDPSAETRFFTLQKQEHENTGCYQDHGQQNFDFDIQIQDDHDYIGPSTTEPLISFRQDIPQATPYPAQHPAQIAPFADPDPHPYNATAAQRPASTATAHTTGNELQQTAAFASEQLLPPSQPDETTHALLRAAAGLQGAREAGARAVQGLADELLAAVRGAPPAVQRWIFTVVKARGQAVWDEAIVEENVVLQRVLRELDDVFRRYSGIGEKILHEQVALLKCWATWPSFSESIDQEDRKTGYLTPAPGNSTPIKGDSIQYNRDTLRELDN